MTRLHADQIEVERGLLAGPDGALADAGSEVTGGVAAREGPDSRVESPVRFRWRGRWYAVAVVLEHWVEAGNWWQRAGPGGSGLALGIDDGERAVWRVEAGRRVETGQHAGAIRPDEAVEPAAADGPMGVYDLRFEWGTGRWSLIRIHD